jgi:hypothetical protein
MRAIVSVVRAIYYFEAGERSTALEELRKVHEAFERAGETLNRLWTECWMARILLVLGRRSEGLRVLERAEQDIHNHRILPFVQLVKRVREQDPMVQATLPQATQPEIVKRGEVVRARALAALQAAGQGKFSTVEALLEMNASQTVNMDYSLDQAIGLIARAILARLSGAEKEAAHLLQKAAARAKEGAIDPDLIPALAGTVGSLRVITPDQRYVTTGQCNAGQGGIVVDGRSHAIGLGRKTVSIARRPVLRRLLYTLAVRPGSSVSKEELAQAIWQGPYHPLRHDNPLKVNVRELRRLLAKSMLSVEFDGTGYKLFVPAGFVFIDQLWMSDEPTRVAGAA